MSMQVISICAMMHPHSGAHVSQDNGNRFSKANMAQDFVNNSLDSSNALPQYGEHACSWEGNQTQVIWKHAHCNSTYRIGGAKNPGPTKPIIKDCEKGYYRINVANSSHLKNNAHIIAKRDFQTMLITEASCDKKQAHEAKLILNKKMKMRRSISQG